MTIAFDARWIGPHGIGRFAAEVARRLPALAPLGVSGRPTDPLDPWRVRRALRRAAPAAYWTPGFNPPARTRVPFAITIHDLIHLDEPGEASTAKRWYYERLVRPALRRAGGVLTVSAYARQRIAQWSGLDVERITVVGNGVDETFTPDGPRRSAPAPYLFFLGTDKPHKNLTRLLEAYTAARLAPEVELVVAGHVAARDWPPGVRAIGAIDEEDLVLHYRGALATVVPSTIEGFGLVALESMACGTPVVAGATSAIPEVLGEDAILVDPHSIEAIARGLRTVCGDNDVRRRLAAAGPSRAARHTWDSVARRVGDVIDALGRV